MITQPAKVLFPLTVLGAVAAVVYGALNANKVDAVNSLDFTWGGQGVASLRTNATISLFQRTGWRQCRSKPTTSDLGSGC